MTRFALGFVFLAALASPAAAQSGHVFGTLRDVSGAVLPGVSVSAVTKNANGETTRRVVTDGSGWYDMREMQEGSWTVTASLPGFAIVQRTVTLQPGEGSEWNAELRVGSLQETITITSAATTPRRTEAPRPATAPAPATPVASGPLPAGVVRVGGNIKAPRKIVNVSPAYPADAAAQGIGGVVILEATIGPTGLVTDVRTLRSIPPLDQAATEALRQWEFTPTLLNGQPVPVVMTATFNFVAN